MRRFWIATAMLLAVLTTLTAVAQASGITDWIDLMWWMRR